MKEFYEGTGDLSKCLCQVVRSVYGLKEAPRLWQEEFTKACVGDIGMTMHSSDPLVFYIRRSQIDYERSASENMLYLKTDPEPTLGDGDRDTVLFTVSHVDDSLVCAETPQLQKWFTARMQKAFKLTNETIKKDIKTGVPFLGYRIIKEGNRLRLSVEHKIEALYDEHKHLLSETSGYELHRKTAKTPFLDDRSPDEDPSYDPDVVPDKDMTHLYRSICASMMWIAVHARPDVCAALSMLMSCCHKVTHHKMRCALFTLKYLYRTKHLTLTYTNEDLGGRRYINDKIDCLSKMQRIDNNDLGLCAFTDASYGFGPARYMYIVCLAGGPVCFKSKMTATTPTSTAESELISLKEGILSASWVRDLISTMGEQPGKVKVFNDNNAALAMCLADSFKFPVRHKMNTLSIVREHIRRDHVMLVREPTESMIADIGTKQMKVNVFNRLLERLYPQQLSKTAPRATAAAKNPYIEAMLSRSMFTYQPP